MRWILVAIAVTGCWRGGLAAPRAVEREPDFACFAWRGGERHGTVCTTRTDCNTLRDHKLLRESDWTYARCTGAGSIACFHTIPDFLDRRGIERCFADTDECERYRARADTRETACRVLQSLRDAPVIPP